MGIGKQIRLNRIFAHPSENFFSVAVDHYIGYTNRWDGLPTGLRKIRDTLEAIVAGKPDAITMHKGIASSAWGPYAGKIPFIMQSIIARPDDTANQQVATIEEAVRMGADAIAVAGFICGNNEDYKLRLIADCVRESAQYDMPVIVHIYPRDITKNPPEVSFKPELVAWVVRCALENGADVIKTPYCGDIESFRQIVSECPVPLIAAGGPKAETIELALNMAQEVIQSGAKGMTVGRNVWGFPDITKAVRLFSAVIHDKMDVNKALELIN
ncbi:TPA: aldolase [bacterium]|nr:aldolase [bacterium]